jgi:hypothetical protein
VVRRHTQDIRYTAEALSSDTGLFATNADATPKRGDAQITSFRVALMRPPPSHLVNACRWLCVEIGEVHQNLHSPVCTVYIFSLLASSLPSKYPSLHKAHSLSRPPPQLFLHLFIRVTICKQFTPPSFRELVLPPILTSQLHDEQEGGRFVPIGRARRAGRWASRRCPWIRGFLPGLCRVPRKPSSNTVFLEVELLLV